MYQNDEVSDIERQSVGKDLWALADAIAYRKTFRTELRKRLMAQARALDVEKEVRTLGTTSQDKGEARSPSWFRRLVTDRSIMGHAEPPNVGHPQSPGVGHAEPLDVYHP